MTPSEKDAHEYCLEWFRIHADQRMRLFNFYILFLGGVVLLASTILRPEYAFVEMISGAVLFVISVVFHQLDARISELIKVAENGLRAVQSRTARRIGEDAIKIAHHAQTKNGTFSYSDCFWVVFLTGGVVGGAMLLHGWSVFLGYDLLSNRAAR